MNNLPVRQKIFGLLIAFTILIVIIDLFRRRKLREEYTWMWILTGAVLLIIILRYEILNWITRFIGAHFPTSALFFFGLLFVILLCLQYAVRISSLDGKLRALPQEVALLKFDLKELNSTDNSPGNITGDQDKKSDQTP